MTVDLPSQYAFLLKCCNASDCKHHLCKENVELPLWFPGDPSFPLPIPDPSFEWGSTECSNTEIKCVMATS